MLLSFCVAINAKAAIKDPYGLVSNFGTATNSLIAVMAAVSLILVPTALIYGLHYHWYPAMGEAIGYRTTVISKQLKN